MQAPTICDFAAREQFRLAARRLSLDPDNAWIGGYVDYEWRYGRHVLECAGVTLSGARVLEFGCNVGATAIVLRTMGSKVTAVDVHRGYVELSRLNAASYGLDAGIEFVHVPDTTRLPFAGGHFDLIICNSVLEYVPHAILAPVQRELDRVLRPRGTILVQGTSNRLWPREVHSRRWLVNYLPRLVDRLLATEMERGVFPWHVRSGFGPAYSDAGVADHGASYLEARKRMGVSAPRRLLLGTVAGALSPLRISIGLLTPSITALLRKDG
jgi:SAM-dependent methyltransferase